MENRPRHINRIAIKAKPERIWDAITNTEMTSKFWFNCEVRSTWEMDSAIEL
ncbi:hypothetical protein [Shimazuella alba]|uniref:hypothetical protein n=1 Tax=Shimazuella alba TaxID=2690964 RepID=UPI001F295D7C|nr:hypothetical protein [Shimazuella alba]